MSTAFRVSRPLLIALPLLALSPGPFPVADFSVRAEMRAPSREVHGRIGTSVATPFGSLPVSGRVAVTHTCDGSFIGTVRYSFLVRLGARLKGIRLVTSLDGRVAPTALADCALLTTELSGRFRIADSTLTGTVRTAADSLVVRGIVRAVGDTAYHIVLAPAESDRTDTAFVTLY